jgi:hypothetical protein
MTSHLSSRFPDRAANLKSTTTMVSHQAILLGFHAAQALFALVLLGLTASGESTPFGLQVMPKWRLTIGNS